MEKGDRGRITSVLAANADLEIAAHFATTLGADAHQLTDTRLVDGDERVHIEDLPLHVVGEDRRCVVAREAKTGLGEIIGAEGKELGTRIAAGDLVGFKSRPW